jgi:hypothetical protein
MMSAGEPRQIVPFLLCKAVSTFDFLTRQELGPIATFEISAMEHLE